MTKAMKSLLKQVAVAAAVGAAVGALRLRGHALPALPVHLQFTLGMRLSLVLWVVFSIYWALAAKDSAPTSTSESLWSRRLHLLLVNAALLLLVLSVPGLTWRFLPANPLLVADGLMTQASFILFAVWARRHLGANWSGEVRIAAGHQLVRSGPYRFLRHPIYTAVLGMYCGTALVSGEIHALLALALVTLAYWRKIRLEERALAEAFGAEHEAYRRHTWALIPGVY
ncbi:MAG TPA: isoprenylcysteine carboxylmethyltransferase family protein [Terriglobales bacterium]|jgi:protein-S-isoprenylcysteine O-methyltransferase Ste14|nr:isoprenylcysteine carboxylmethyltransferase family protein [Terriglobales bacterium]